MTRAELIDALYTENPRVEIVKESFEDYLAATAVSRSSLVDVFDPEQGGCPYLFIMQMCFPHLFPDKGTAVWEQGTALHHYYLEPEEFTRLYPVLDDARKAEFLQAAADQGSKSEGVKKFIETGSVRKFSRLLKPFQKWQEDCKAQGLTILTQANIDKFERMKSVFMKHPDILPIWEKPHQTELSVYAGYRGPRGEWPKAIQVKARIDFLHDDPDDEEAFDFKKAREATPVKFSKAVDNRRLDIQSAFYCGVLTWAGRKTTSFSFIAQEDEFPFLIGVHDMPQDWIRWGQLHYEKLLSDLRECLEKNWFPDPGRGVLFPPDYLAKRMEEIG